MQYKILLKKYIKKEFLREHWSDIGRYKIKVTVDDEQFRALSSLQIEVLQELIDLIEPECEVMRREYESIKEREGEDSETEEFVDTYQTYRNLLRLNVACLEGMNKVQEKLDEADSEEEPPPPTKDLNV